MMECSFQSYLTLPKILSLGNIKITIKKIVLVFINMMGKINEKWPSDMGNSDFNFPSHHLKVELSKLLKFSELEAMYMQISTTCLW